MTNINLSGYTRVGRYDLPEPTRTAAPANSLLAKEASAITYNRDTGTLFVVGDGGTSIVQVSKNGTFINSMTLPQDTFEDTEGLAYAGGGKFVLLEERVRQANLFTYTPGGAIGTVQTVKLGTTIGNDGLEGITTDPQTNGYVLVKESGPQGIFQTTLNFPAGTASNGSASTTNSTNLFNPALLNLNDLADVFALSNIPDLFGRTDYSHLLVLSQDSAKIYETDRAGNIFSSLTIASDAGNPLSIADQHHEGLTMDDNGYLYLVSEQGGGDANHPQLWVYQPPASVPEPACALVITSAVAVLGVRRRAGRH